MAAEAGAHCRKNFLGEGMFLARAEPSKQGCGQNLGGHRLVYGRIHGPATFAGILDKARVVIQRVVLRERGGCKVQQPRGDYAAAPPYFGNVRDSELEAMLRRQRAGIGVLQNVKTFGVGLHQTVFDTVVTNFENMYGTASYYM